MNSSCLTVYVAFLVTSLGGGYVLHLTLDLPYIFALLVAMVFFFLGLRVWARALWPTGNLNLDQFHDGP